MKTTVVREIASRIITRENCIKSGNLAWQHSHEDVLRALAEELPSGSGIDCGTKIDEDSTSDRIVLNLAYHHMNDGGMYDGWTEHQVIITPSLAFGFDLRITGRNRNDIKEYLHDVYWTALSAEIETTELVKVA